ncbi:anti-sigma factor domain-containing protein [Rossellomorea oryzaecorticis]|uniref:Anti-sigma factor domain-containing protein n=1 Tax=Rossellomorea oryzaecorticis TaxID=1396505 RepID=A0ABU9KDN1_9BACI
MKKGIIMEIRRDVLIMMTPDGEFMNGKKTANQRYTIGEEIPFYPIKENSQVKVKRNWKAAASILTAAVLILTLFSGSFLQSNKAYAYVSVDINPSLELSLNKEQQVIDITPYNEDGEVLIEKLEDWKKEDVSEVAEEILRVSEKLGYLKKDQNVWITSTFTDLSENQTHSALLKELNEFVKQYNDQHSAEIIMKETTEDIREEAVEKGVTAGTLLKEKKDKELIVNPDGDKAEKTAKEPIEEKKADSPASNTDKSKPQHVEDELNKGAHDQKQGNKAESKSNGNGHNKPIDNKGSEGNKASERSSSSQKNQGAPDNRGDNQNKKKNNNNQSDNRPDKNNGKRDKPNPHENKNHGNSHHNQSGEKRDSDSKGKNN